MDNSPSNENKQKLLDAMDKINESFNVSSNNMKDIEGDEPVIDRDKQKQLNALNRLSELSEAFSAAMKDIENESETYWNSLTKKEQLDVFCAVSRRIYKGEIEDKGSYRHVLYSVFGFGPEAYAAAQMSNYLTIHNSIVDSAEYDEKLLKVFCEKMQIDDADAKVEKFLKILSGK